MLSPAWLNSMLNKTHDKEYHKAHKDGLHARVRKTGAVSFIFRYRWKNKPTKITLGRYPDMKLGEASSLATEYTNMLANNIDPREYIREQQIKGDTGSTVEDVVREWHQHHFKDHPLLGVKHKYPYAVMTSFETHVFPELGSLAWDRVDRRMWSIIFKRVQEQAPSIASRLVTACKQVAGYVIDHGISEHHPLIEYSAKKSLGIKKGKTKRTLTMEELRDVYDLLEYSRYHPSTKILYKLMLVYGCRSKELRLLERSHLNFKNGLWTVPPELAKPRDLKDVENHHTIVRPITPYTEKLFREAMSYFPNYELVFPSLTHEHEAPKDDGALVDIPYRLTEKVNRIRAERGVVGMPRWSNHDLRRTVRTFMGSIATRNAAERMLGHVLKDMDGVYDQNLYIREQAQAYEKWTKLLREHVWGHHEDKVVSTYDGTHRAD